ncbi:MAG: inorganic diphosphatase [Flavobacteriales bacterium]|nr:inorganic diphosphatase [Flavobacteriales bacterium]
MTGFCTLQSNYTVIHGFVPRISGQEGDPLDVLVISMADIVPLTLVRCRIMDLMRMADNVAPDDNCYLCPLADPSVQRFQDIVNVPE